MTGWIPCGSYVHDVRVGEAVVVVVEDLGRSYFIPDVTRVALGSFALNVTPLCAVYSKLGLGD